MSKVDLNTIGLRPTYSFDQLVIGPNNHVAVAACKEIIRAPGDVYNPLFIYGHPGVGKTHLMQAVAHEMIKKNPHCSIRYISAERFINEILNAMSEDKVLDVRRTYSNLDLLIVDDVQYLVESQISQEELFHVFNNLHQANHQVILAADRPPNLLTGLNKNIKSRLEWGLSTDVKVPDVDTRFQILKKKQEAQDLHLSDEMLMYVAKLFKSNVRELEGFLKRMHAYVTLSNQQVSFDLVKTVVREILPEGALDAKAEAEAVHEPAPVEKPAKKAALPTPPSSEIEAEPVKPAPVPVVNKSVEDAAKNGHKKPENVMPKVAAETPEPLPKKVPPKPEKTVYPSSPLDELPDIVMPSKSDDHSSFDLLLDSIDLPVDEEVKDEKANGHSPPPPPKKFTAPPPPPSVNVPKPVTPSPAASTAAKRASIPPPPDFSNKPLPVPAAVPETVPEPVPVMDEVGEALSDGSEETGELPTGHKEVAAVFFYPEGKKQALDDVHRKFQEVIKKHKLKFRLRKVHNEAYSMKGKVNYSAFVDVCKANKVPVAIVIGPPPDMSLPEQDFYDLLTVTLDVQGISLQLVNWTEINKDYRYLNLALDIALVRTR